jgi:hypothetical protein
VRERDAIDLALAGEEWMGLAVFIYVSGPWTIIKEVSCGLALRSGESWLDLAQGGDLVFASYDDTVAYARLVVIERGRLVREFFQDEQDSSHDVNVGRLPEEAGGRFETWSEVLWWVDEDELKLDRPPQGWLWIHRAA